MHMVIRAIVYAKTEAEALQQACSVFDGLCEEGRAFDSYTTFAEQGSTVSGRGRWGDLCPVTKASSPEGKQFIEEGFQSTKAEFKRNLDMIRQAVASYTDEQLFEGEDITDDLKGFFRYRCRKAGSGEGSAVWLYDHDGDGIWDSRELDEALNKWPAYYENEPNPYADMEVWVVPADVHY